MLGTGSVTTGASPWVPCSSGFLSGTGAARGSLGGALKATPARSSAGGAAVPLPFAGAARMPPARASRPAPSPLPVWGSSRVAGLWVSVTFVGGREPCLSLGRLPVVDEDAEIGVVPILGPACVAPPHVVGALLPRDAGLREENRVDPCGMLLHHADDRAHQGVGQQVGLEAEVEEALVFRVVVVLLQLEAGVR